jgi:hypothetical protein
VEMEKKEFKWEEKKQRRISKDIKFYFSTFLESAWKWAFDSHESALNSFIHIIHIMHIMHISNIYMPYSAYNPITPSLSTQSRPHTALELQPITTD